jgi:hypothetical protein
MWVGATSVLLARSAVKGEVVISAAPQHNLDDLALDGAEFVVGSPTHGERRDDMMSARRGGNMPARPVPAEDEPMAQTSVRFPRTLLKRARIRAATDEVSLQALLISALEAELERRDKLEARKTARRRTRTATK